MENPYYTKWYEVNLNRTFASGGILWSARNELVRKYAWAIPDDNALNRIVNFAGTRPIVEMGAGLGYWGKLLGDLGADIHCFDREVSDSSFGNVKQADELTFVSILTNLNDPILMLCWPPYDEPMAYNYLRVYLDAIKNPALIYIGEGCYGCTGDDSFHELLKTFDDDTYVPIPNWDGIHDGLYLYR